MELHNEVKCLKNYLDKAQRVIIAYSIASDGYESAADVLSLRNENQRLFVHFSELFKHRQDFWCLQFLIGYKVIFLYRLEKLFDGKIFPCL